MYNRNTHQKGDPSRTDGAEDRQDEAPKQNGKAPAGKPAEQKSGRAEERQEGVAEKKLIIKKRKYQGTTSVISARLPDSMIQEIDRVAEETGYNRNEIITRCLECAIGNLETDTSEGGRK